MNNNEIEMKKFDTDDLTMNSLLISDLVILEIPVNQRKYSWENDQVEKFWDDIIKTKGVDDARHYLGVISLIKKEKVGIDLVKYELIDGQQRMITTMLFLAALRDISITITDGETPRRIQNKYLRVDTNRRSYEKLKPCRIDTYTFDMLVNISIEKLDKNICDSKKLGHKDIDVFKRDITKYGEEAINKKMINAYNFFCKKILEIIKDDNNAEPENLILDMLDIMSKLEIIEVISGNISNIFLYFDSLNNRGLHLNAMDIIRNNFFKIVSEKFCDKIVEYGELWDNLVLKLEDFDCGKFLKYYLICETGYIYSAKDLPVKYDELFKQIENEDKMNNIIRKILDYAQNYIKIFDKCTDIDHIDNINFLGQQACHSFIMDYLYYVSDEDRINNILDLIEKMMYKRIVCGFSTKQLDGIFREIIISKTSNEKLNLYDYDDDKIRKLIEENTPSTQQVVNSFDIREWKKDNITIYTLYKFENYKNNSIDTSINKVKSKYNIIYISNKDKIKLENIMLAENDIFSSEKSSFIEEIKNKKILLKSNILSIKEICTKELSIDNYINKRKAEISIWLNVI